MVNPRGAFLGNNRAFLQGHDDMVAWHTKKAAFMTRADQELLDKQFRWLSRSRGAEFLALSMASAILLILLLGSAGIA
jgi:hypothetical protein